MSRKAIYLAVLVALGLLTVPVAVNAQVTNLAPNPSFEEDEPVQDDGSWTAWCTWNDAAGTGSIAKFDDTEAVDGLRSLRVDAKGGTDWYFIVALISMPTKNGTKYTSSFWAKAQAPRSIGAQLKAADNSVQWGATSFNITQDWAEYHFTVAAQSADTKLEFFCAASTIPFWLDFVSFYEGDYVPGIMPPGAGPRPQAGYPTPKIDAIVDQTTVKLEWKAGDFAVSHRVYFGDSLEAVESGQVQPADTTALSLRVGNTPGTALTPGKTYYWRVDEVNNADPASPWKGDVWRFRVRPLIAWNPMPADGLKYVDPNQDLSWEYGLGNFFHTGYIGESFEDVSTAASPSWANADPTFDPGTFKIGTTYYWRVDEFSGGLYRKGDVWSFTTVPDIAVTNPDLLGWWTLDEGMGTTAVDWSGHGKHGQITGSASWTHGMQGGALYLSGGASVAIPPMNVSTNTVTLTAWVKKDGSQSDWSGVVFKREGIATGMGFGPANELRYHWNDKYWDYTTGIIPPDQEWFFMALVIEPTQGTLYFNGTDTFAQNKAVHDPDPFTGTLVIGRDAQGGRDLKGTVDDVRFYNKALSAAEIKAVMRGDPSLAWSPTPAQDARMDIRDVDSLSWSAGDAAATHDVYFGKDEKTVADADHSSPTYKGNQAGTSFSLASLVDINAGDCFWRIDEVEAGGTVHKGNVWQLTVLPYLLVDDFESYTNESPNRVFQAWIDGAGFSPDDFFPKGNAGNASGSLVGYDPQDGTIVETRIVHGGSQSMPVAYDNTAAPKYSEAERTFSSPQNWTVAGVTTLVVHFRGAPDNKGQLYVKINGTKILYPGDAADIAGTAWVAWNIELASAGVSLTSIRTLAIGVDGGETGTLYIDDIRVIKP